MTGSIVGNQAPHLWYRDKLVEKHYENRSSAFATTSAYQSDYSIHPNWVSEGGLRKKSASTMGRAFKPWPFEFCGARNWPERPDGSAWRLPPCIPPLGHRVPTAEERDRPATSSSPPSPPSSATLTMTEQRPAWKRDPLPPPPKSSQAVARSLPLRPRSFALTSRVAPAAGPTPYSYYHVFTVTDLPKERKQPVGKKASVPLPYWQRNERLTGSALPTAIEYSNMVNTRWIA